MIYFALHLNLNYFSDKYNDFTTYDFGFPVNTNIRYPINYFKFLPCNQQLKTYFQSYPKGPASDVTKS